MRTARRAGMGAARLDDVRQRLPDEELHDEVRQLRRRELSEVGDRDDVRVVHARGGPGLLDETLGEVRVARESRRSTFIAKMRSSAMWRTS